MRPLFSMLLCVSFLFLSSSIHIVLACQSKVNFLKQIMSALNTPNTSPQPEVVTISNDILIVYCEVGLSILTIFVNLINFFWIRQRFETTLVYQIQQIDSLVTAVSQIGIIAILLSSISDAPNAYICAPATSFSIISFIHFLLSNLLMVTGQ